MLIPSVHPAYKGNPKKGIIGLLEYPRQMLKMHLWNAFQYKQWHEYRPDSKISGTSRESFNEKEINKIDTVDWRWLFPFPMYSSVCVKRENTRSQYDSIWSRSWRGVRDALSSLVYFRVLALRTACEISNCGICRWTTRDTVARRESRHIPKCTGGKIRARRSSQGLFLSWKCSHLHDIRGVVCSRRLYYIDISLFLSRSLMGGSTILPLLFW